MIAATGDVGVRPTPRSPVAFGLLSAFLLLAAGGFVSLGVWQVHRLATKVNLIERIDERIHASPTAAPGPAEWTAVDAAHDAYRHVRIAGVFQNDHETQVLAVTALGAGYWVITPLRTDEGYTVLINRGFVPTDRRDPATRQEPRSAARQQITGLLRITEPKGGFLRRNDPLTDRWYSRDVAAIEKSRQLSEVAPYFIDADASLAPSDGDAPVGGLTVVDLPNNHLSYALTWFAMAVLAIAGLVFVVVDERRQRRIAGRYAGTEAGHIF